jgi:hypothetical protein
MEDDMDGYVPRTVTENARKSLVEKTEGKRQVRRPMRRWKRSTEIDLKEI